MNAFDFSGKTVLVTGGGAGIGLAIAEAFASYGANVAVAEIDPERAGKLQLQLSKKTEALVSVIDVRDSAQVASFVDSVADRFCRIDVLVNNVGDFLRIARPMERTTEAEWDALYAINLRHLFVVTRACLPLLRRQSSGASIINIATIEAFRGIPMSSIYSAFKAGVIGFSRSLAVELAPSNIRVNAIAPETTETEQIKPSQFVNPKYKDLIPYWTPLGRFGYPQDVAGAALFLASDLSAWITGTTIHVDGGALAAAGFYRTPQGRWTNVPVIVDQGAILR